MGVPISSRSRRSMSSTNIVCTWTLKGIPSPNNKHPQAPNRKRGVQFVFIIGGCNMSIIRGSDYVTKAMLRLDMRPTMLWPLLLPCYGIHVCLQQKLESWNMAVLQPKPKKEGQLAQIILHSCSNKAKYGPAMALYPLGAL